MKKKLNLSIIILGISLLSSTAQIYPVRPQLSDKHSFSMILLPDPQSYNKFDANQPLFELQTAWIANSIEPLNIKGVLCTGDLAYRDEDGCYYIVGRMGRFLKLFGMRIGLDECEQIIKGKYPMECACVGTDEKLTVYLTDGKYATEVKEVLVEKTRLVASAFEVRVIDEIPKNEAGKILYSKLNV